MPNFLLIYSMLISSVSFVGIVSLAADGETPAAGVAFCEDWGQGFY
jgi:hypothetical protein